jgi:hypothetical protein
LLLVFYSGGALLRRGSAISPVRAQ